MGVLMAGGGSAWMNGALRSGNLGVPRARATCPLSTRPSCGVHISLSILPSTRLPGEVLADPQPHTGAHHPIPSFRKRSLLQSYNVCPSKVGPVPSDTRVTDLSWCWEQHDPCSALSLSVGALDERGSELTWNRAAGLRARWPHLSLGPEPAPA